MRALLRKDLLLIRKAYKVYFVAILLFGIAAAFRPDYTFFTVYPFVLAALIPYNLFSLDERSGWNAFSRSLPFTTQQIVGAKYIATLAVLGVTWAVFALLSILIGGWNAEELRHIFGILCAALIAPVLFLPAAIRWGTQKMFYLAVGLIMALTGLAFGLILGSRSEWLMGEMSVPAAVVMTAAAAAAAALLFISYKVSVRWYEEKEF